MSALKLSERDMQPVTVGSLTLASSCGMIDDYSASGGDDSRDDMDRLDLSEHTGVLDVDWSNKVCVCVTEDGDGSHDTASTL